MSEEPTSETTADQALDRRRRPLGLEMRGLDDYMRLAEVLARSELVPPRPTAASRRTSSSRWAWAASSGCRPSRRFRAYTSSGPAAPVRGSGARARARLGRAGEPEVEGTDTEATCTATRRGQGPMAITFTFEDARKMGLTRNAAYTSQPGWMLQTRAIGRVLHRLFSDSCARA